jgi:2-polyprenyl-6-methoxyphenol hydroxylase-like FAD-dependent oxidoreductase
MTAWNRLYEALKHVFPSERYHQGIHLERGEQDERKVTACFTGGARVDADLLIGSDGLRSTVRNQFVPERAMIETAAPMNYDQAEK